MVYIYKDLKDKSIKVKSDGLTEKLITVPASEESERIEINAGGYLFSGTHSFGLLALLDHDPEKFNEHWEDFCVYTSLFDEIPISDALNALGFEVSEVRFRRLTDIYTLIVLEDQYGVCSLAEYSNLRKVNSIQSRAVSVEYNTLAHYILHNNYIRFEYPTGYYYGVKLSSTTFKTDGVHYVVVDNLEGREPELLKTINEMFPIVNLSFVKRIIRFLTRNWVKKLGTDWKMVSEKEIEYDGNIVPIYVIKDGTLYTLKPEYRERYTIHKLRYRLDKSKLFTRDPNTRHPHVNRYVGKDNSSICIGDARIRGPQDLARIIGQLAFINPSSSYYPYEITDEMITPIRKRRKAKKGE